MGRSTSKLCFLSCNPCVLPWTVRFISTVLLGIHRLLIQVKNDPCPCLWEPPVLVNLKVGLICAKHHGVVDWHLQQNLTGRGMRVPSRMQ